MCLVSVSRKGTKNKKKYKKTNKTKRESMFLFLNGGKKAVWTLYFPKTTHLF